jgi:DNA-binding MarR family transcriptional regulator
MFSTDEQGSVDEEISEESQGLLQQFVDYIKTHKVVVLEELAREFGLRTEDVVNRVRGLEQMGYITGVIDDRGKFICISEAEMKAVAKFIQQKGRITVAELAREINKLINLSDKTVDK